MINDSPQPLKKIQKKVTTNTDLVQASLSSKSSWHERLQQLSSHAFEIKPANETTINDNFVATQNGNEKQVLIFSNTVEPSLKRWVIEQRHRCNKQNTTKRGRGCLDQDKIDSLNAINFIWNPHEHIWDIRLNELREFRKKHGHCVVPQKTHNHFSKLGLWVKNVRKRKSDQEKETPRPRCSFLSKKQIADLDNLNFEWNANEAIWLEKFNELKEFHKTNGHTHVAHSNCTDKSLVQWVGRQRHQCKIEEKVKLLDSIEFIWSFSEALEDQWSQRFNELKEFYRRNGHAKVTNSNCTSKSLICWVDKQRQRCKNEKRITLLNSISFIWPKRLGATGEKPNDAGKSCDIFQPALE